MPSRLSKIFRPTDKEKAALAEAELKRSDTGLSTASSSSPPPTYNEAPPEYDEDHQLEDPPSMTAGFSNLTLSDSPTADMALPEIDETIAHLKVLEAFFRLRQKVGSCDGAFGIRDEWVRGSASQDIDDTVGGLLAKLAEKRWAIYIARAVDRFDQWVRAIAPAEMPSIADFERDGASGAITKPTFSKKQPIRLDRNNMPPLDVLMIWHAYMLNPRAYMEDCIRYGRMQLWIKRFPWKAVTECIDSETFAYSADSESAWVKLTGLPWDSFADGSLKSVNCLSCLQDSKVPWTTCHAGKSFEGSEHGVDEMLSEGEGYCDRNFRAICTTCEAVLNHDMLSAGKFCADLRHLIGPENAPMAGTLLSMAGLPLRVGKQTDEVTHKTAFRTVNALFASGLGKKILGSPKLSGKGAACSMKVIRDTVEEVMTTNKSYMRVVRGSNSHKMTRAEKIVFRKMMSRYWENGSPVALDLVGAVIRQGSFIEKMHNIDWLHSPALPSTMARLILKYERFVVIMQDPMNMAVPTLDVDLAWHTHQLNPAGYLQYTVRTTKQFIDHDDKVAETKLNDAFAWTSKTYQKMFGAPYSECTCWYCEAIRESHTSSASRLFNSNTAKANDLLHPTSQDPMKSVHISAHNAVRPTDTAKYTADAKLHADKLEMAYQKACERAKKKGKKEPKRDDYYYSTAWGYPVYIPAYSPYVGYMPYTPIYYPVMIGCMALGAGAVGNCANGTCGGGVAAGACAGSGAGGCANGIAGGCGSSGGSGGCGGGGGGCGGGGGS